MPCALTPIATMSTAIKSAKAERAMSGCGREGGGEVRSSER